MKGNMLRNWFARRRREDEDAHGAESNLPSAPARASGESVLVVDDSRTQVASLVKLLESEGYKTLTAEDGREAIRQARKHLPDAILMDIVMPEMNGFKATRYLTRHPETLHIPVIIVSGVERDSDRFWGLKMGARDFLAKPVNGRELLEKLASVLADSASSDETA